MTGPEGDVAKFRGCLPPRLIVGLGNPGAEYEDTRHNIAWRVLDRLAERHKATEFVADLESKIARVRLAGDEAWLIKPWTYMNRSGDALEAVLDSLPEESPLDRLLVICDDVHLPLGRIRFRSDGRCGGHNGLASIECALASDVYPRLRIGVGPVPGRDLIEFVLGSFRNSEWPGVECVVARAAEAVEDWACAGLAFCQNQYNGEQIWEETPSEAEPPETLPKTNEI